MQPVNSPRSQKETYQILAEITRSVRLISDSLDAIADGKAYHSIVIASQIRSLLSEKRKDAHSILLHLSEVFNRQLFIYVDRGNDVGELPVKPDIHLVMGDVSPMRINRRQEKVNLVDFYAKEIVAEYYGKTFSLEGLVRLFANNSGGAHFSKYVQPELQDIPFVQEQGYPLFLNFIMRFADALVVIIRELLRDLFDLEFHIAFFVSEMPKEKFSIMDIEYPGTPMGFNIAFNAMGKIRISIRPLDGVPIDIDFFEVINWEKPLYLHTRMRLTDQLTTEITVNIDGKEFSRHKAIQQLLVYNDLTHQKFQIGRDINSQVDSKGFNFGAFVWIKRQSSLVERAKLILTMDSFINNEDSEYHRFKNNSFFKKDVGKDVMEIEGGFDLIKYNCR